MISREIGLNPEMLEAGRAGDWMYRNELQMRERGGKLSLRGEREGEPTNRDAGRETLEGKTLEALLYYVLAGDGRRTKIPARV